MTSAYIMIKLCRIIRSLWGHDGARDFGIKWVHKYIKIPPKEHTHVPNDTQKTIASLLSKLWTFSNLWAIINQSMHWHHPQTLFLIHPEDISGICQTKSRWQLMPVESILVLYEIIQQQNMQATKCLLCCYF